MFVGCVDLMHRYQILQHQLVRQRRENEAHKSVEKAANNSGEKVDRVVGHHTVKLTKQQIASHGFGLVTHVYLNDLGVFSRVPTQAKELANNKLPAIVTSASITMINNLTQDPVSITRLSKTAPLGGNRSSTTGTTGTTSNISNSSNSTVKSNKDKGGVDNSNVTMKANKVTAEALLKHTTRQGCWVVICKGLTPAKAAWGYAIDARRARVAQELLEEKSFAVIKRIWISYRMHASWTRFIAEGKAIRSLRRTCGPRMQLWAQSVRRGLAVKCAVRGI
jgi:hypothetical protein